MKKPLITAVILIIILIAIGAWQNSQPRQEVQETPTTETDTTGSTPMPQGKLNILEVCGSALAYMTFPSQADAELFITDCIAGKHPEVIERYISDMNLDGAAI